MARPKPKTRPAKTAHRHALVPPWMHVAVKLIAGKTGENMTKAWSRIAATAVRREWVKLFPNTELPEG